jgi:hypothetical protein
MRSLILAAAFGLAWPVAVATAQTGARPAAEPQARSAAGQRPPSPSGINEEARRKEEERHKRWDDRMRRATRSLCDRC